MALSNSYGTSNPGAAIGNREDLSAGISMLEPELAPIYSLLPKVSITNSYTEWLVDKLEAPSATATAEGEPVSTVADKFQDQTRLGNYIQKRRKTFGVTYEQEAQNSAGPANFDKALAKTTKEIKRDMELIVAGNQDRAAQSGGVAWQTRGFGNWISSSGPSDVPAAYRTPAGSIHTSGDFTESKMQDILGSIFTQTGTVKNAKLIGSVALRKAINQNFARAASGETFSKYRVEEYGNENTVTLAVEIFDSNFGQVELINANPLCLPSGTNGFLINPEYAAIGNLLPLGYKMLPEDGTGQKAFMDVVFTTICKNPLAHGKILALS